MHLKNNCFSGYKDDINLYLIIKKIHVFRPVGFAKLVPVMMTTKAVLAGQRRGTARLITR